jgi:hypothetical protein
MPTQFVVVIPSGEGRQFCAGFVDLQVLAAQALCGLAPTS